METIPTTATAADALADRKRILDENAILKQEGDTFRREHDQWREARDAMKSEVAALAGLPEDSKMLDKLLSTNLREQRERLVTEISALETQRDLRQTEENGLAKAITDKQAHIDTLEGRKKALTADIMEKEAWYQTTGREQSGEMEKKRNDLSEINGTLATARAEIALIRTEAANKQEWILEEEKRLSIKGRDLAIYEGRIRKAAAELDPPMEIVLTT